MIGTAKTTWIMPRKRRGRKEGYIDGDHKGLEEGGMRDI
tara:strand:+ start:451 stop:567 length:117 start_codon:yes stop_codon:yes gene_type:complete